ncbi:MAG: putative lipid II flippase FtsW [Lachnospiraceae bacterium]|nr:putative lipid II flippase FtsW [Lachnospiraceae bacterium]
MLKKKNSGTNEYFVDYSLLFIVIFLVGFGLLMIYSVSSYKAFASTGDSAYFLKRQAIAALLGLVAMIVISFVPYQWWKALAVPAIAVSVISLFLLYTPLGLTRNGATRWLGRGAFSVQPAEICKIGMILFLATIISKIGRNAIRSLRAAVIVIGTGVILAVLIRLISDNMSSAVIVLGISVVMLFVASPDYKPFLIGGALGLGAIAAAVYFIDSTSQNGGFRFRRVLAWLHPEEYSDSGSFQTVQAMYAIGSGGVFGKGLGKSIQKLGFVPEPQNDMIFSIICEELGLFGAFAIILLFIMLIWRLMIIASNCEDSFGCMLVSGIIAHISIQVILNIGVVTNTIPNTGISLPFISYGGTALLLTMSELGLALGVGRGISVGES